MSKKFTTIGCFVLLLVCMIVPIVAFAQNAEPKPVTLMSSFPGLGTVSTGIIPFLNAFFKILLSVAAILSVIFIAIGGFEIMSKDTPFYISEGKDRIQSAVIGLLIIMTSYIVLWTINPDLVSLDIFKNLETIKTQPGFVAPTGAGAANQAGVQGRAICEGTSGCASNAITAAQCTAVAGCSVRNFNSGVGSVSCRCVTPEDTTSTPAPQPQAPTAPTTGPGGTLPGSGPTGTGPGTTPGTPDSGGTPPPPGGVPTP